MVSTGYFDTPLSHPSLPPPLPCQTEALAGRQSAVYTLQRKLKACRQNLESKDLHTGLLQKKVAALEEKVKTYGHQESGLETAMDKVGGNLSH